MNDTPLDGSTATASPHSDGKPLTTRDRVIGVALGAVLIGYCIAVWIQPDLTSIDRSNFSGRGGRSVAGLINLLWWWPTATVAGLFGALVVFVSLKPPSAK